MIADPFYHPGRVRPVGIASQAGGTVRERIGRRRATLTNVPSILGVQDTMDSFGPVAEVVA